MTRKDDPNDPLDLRAVTPYDPDEPITLTDGLRVFVCELERLPSSTKRWLRWWSVRN